MNSREAIILLVMIKVAILAIIFIASGIYAISISIIRRFHNPIHLLTLNVCITSSICALFWIIYFIMSTFYVTILFTEKSCLLVLYLQTVVNCQVLYSLCVVSLNRLFIIVYRNNTFFRTKAWFIMCVSIQWMLGFLLPLPSFSSSLQHCFISGLELNYQLYTLVIIAIIPLISQVISNGAIIIYSHQSARRVHAMIDHPATNYTLHQRESRLLKHMLFMFIVFFCGWVPMYIIAAINWTGEAISYTLHHGLTILPALSLLIDVLNLFLYNYTLRKYFSRKFKRFISQT